MVQFSHFDRWLLTGQVIRPIGGPWLTPRPGERVRVKYREESQPELTPSGHALVFGDVR